MTIDIAAEGPEAEAAVEAKYGTDMVALKPGTVVDLS